MKQNRTSLVEATVLALQGKLQLNESATVTLTEDVSLLDKLKFYFKQDKTIADYFNRFVPNEGKADTVGGEIIRAFNTIKYRWSNDGDIYFVGYGLETAGNSACYLINKGFKTFIDDCGTVTLNKYGKLVDKEPYEALLNKAENEVFEYLKSNPDIFKMENDVDSSEFGEPESEFKEYCFTDIDFDYQDAQELNILNDIEEVVNQYGAKLSMYDKGIINNVKFDDAEQLEREIYSIMEDAESSRDDEEYDDDNDDYYESKQIDNSKKDKKEETINISLNDDGSSVIDTPEAVVIIQDTTVDSEVETVSTCEPEVEDAVTTELPEEIIEDEVEEETAEDTEVATPAQTDNLDNAIEEVTSLNEALNFKKYNILRDPDGDFSDNSKQFKGYICNNMPITYFRDKDNIDIMIRVDKLEGLTGDEYDKLPSYKYCDKYSEVEGEDAVDLQDLANICEQLYTEYQEALNAVAEISDEDYKTVTDEILDKVSTNFTAAKEFLKTVNVYDDAFTDKDIKEIRRCLDSLKEDVLKWSWNNQIDTDQKTRRYNIEHKSYHLTDSECLVDIKNIVEAALQRKTNSTEVVEESKDTNTDFESDMEALQKLLDIASEQSACQMSIQIVQELREDLDNILKRVNTNQNIETKIEENKAELNEALDFKKYDIIRDSSADFSDDGSRFLAYTCNNMPITYLKQGENIYLSIRVDELEGLEYAEYSKLPSYQECNKYNGVKADTVDLQDVANICKRIYEEYQDALTKINEVSDEEFKEVIDEIYQKHLNDLDNLKKFLKPLDFTDVQFSEYKINTIKNYLNNAEADLEKWSWENRKNESQASRRETIRNKEYNLNTSWYIKEIKEIVEELLSAKAETEGLEENREADLNYIKNLLEETKFKFDANTFNTAISNYLKELDEAVECFKTTKLLKSKSRMKIEGTKINKDATSTPITLALHQTKMGNRFTEYAIHEVGCKMIEGKQDHIQAYMITSSSNTNKLTCKNIITKKGE